MCPIYESDYRIEVVPTLVYDYLMPNASVKEDATFWPPATANAWDGKWHSIGQGKFIRYERTVWGGGYFQLARPATAREKGIDEDSMDIIGWNTR
jgi:hypothetical protein